VSERHRPRWVLVAMSGSVAMVFLDQTVVGVALPSIGRDLHADATVQQWVVTAYIVAFGALVVVGGNLGDRIGHLRTFVAGVGVFVLASALSGLAPTPEALIASRAAQGAGAALMQPASLTLVVTAFAPAQRGRAVAVYYNVALGMLVAGPLIGGLLTELASWRWVFFVNVPVALGTVALALEAHPAEPARAEAHAPDRVGAALLALGLGGVAVGLQQGSAWGWGSAPTVGFLAAGLLALLGFVGRELRHPHPLLDLRLFRDAGFTLDNVVVLVTRYAMVGILVYLALWLQNDRGFRPIEAGLGLLPAVLALLVGNQGGGALLDRMGARTPDVIGTGAMAIGFFVTIPALAAHSYGWLVPGLLLIGAGTGLAAAANTDAVARAPEAVRGGASGVVQTARQVGGILAVPVTGGLLAAGMGLGGTYAITGTLLTLTAAAVVAFQPTQAKAMVRA
jgi:EmrB/QacA subfamily drug resistance transporter